MDLSISLRLGNTRIGSGVIPPPIAAVGADYIFDARQGAVWTDPAGTQNPQPGTIAERTENATYPAKTLVASNGVLYNTAANDLPYDWTNGARQQLDEPLGENKFVNPFAPATQTVTVINATEYTVSCHGSGSITLSGAGTGTVTQGSPVTFTTTSTSLTCTVSGSLDAAQVETGNVATSFADGVRNADSDRLSNLFLSLANGGSGSFLLCGTRGASGGQDTEWEIGDNTNDNRIEIRIFANDFIALRVVTGGVAVEQTSNVAVAKGSPYAISVRWANNDLAISVNGSVPLTAGVVTIPGGLTQAYLNRGRDGTPNQFSTWFDQFALSTGAWTNQQLQDLSAAMLTYNQTAAAFNLTVGTSGLSWGFVSGSIGGVDPDGASGYGFNEISVDLSDLFVLQFAGGEQFPGADEIPVIFPGFSANSFNAVWNGANNRYEASVPGFTTWLSSENGNTVGFTLFRSAPLDGPWLLASGAWDDLGFWVDTAVWID